MNANTPDKVEYAKDSRGEWRWTLRNTGNGKIIDSSNEGFGSKWSARRNFRRVMKARVDL
jgi:uncharacterized protein YegP (UPF0339 family)